MENSQLSEFGEILLFIVGAIIFIIGGLVTAYLIRPNRPNAEKNTTYECGEDPTGTAWGQFNIRFYIVALIFILFDVEIVFLFPWATVFGNKALIEGTNGMWGWFAIVEMMIFILILVLGLAYAWAKGYLDWIRPQVIKSDFKSLVPDQLYDNVNSRYEKEGRYEKEEKIHNS
jgi:NADH-quinone oxidoreductase subunit A